MADTVPLSLRGVPSTEQAARAHRRKEGVGLLVFGLLTHPPFRGTAGGPALIGAAYSAQVDIL